MKKIYQLQPANNFQCLLSCAPFDPAVAGRINRTSILADWISSDFRFENVDNQAWPQPDITKVTDVTGVIAFPLSQLEFIFPLPHPDVEFLPIQVAGVPWVLLHCLRTTSKYDSTRSKFHRATDVAVQTPEREAELLAKLANALKSEFHESDFAQYMTGEIFLFEKLVVVDSSLDECELFTIADSNRATIFALPSFVNRIKRLKLKGLNFREIGLLEME